MIDIKEIITPEKINLFDLFLFEDSISLLISEVLLLFKSLEKGLFTVINKEIKAI